jgi:hypothetical protein
MYKLTITYSFPRLTKLDKIMLPIFGVVVIGLIVLCGLK